MRKSISAMFLAFLMILVIVCSGCTTESDNTNNASTANQLTSTQIQNMVENATCPKCGAKNSLDVIEQLSYTIGSSGPDYSSLTGVVKCNKCGAQINCTNGVCEVTS